MKEMSQQVLERFKGSLRLFKKFYATELENLKEMTKFLDFYNLLKLNQEETKHLNYWPIAIK